MNGRELTLERCMITLQKKGVVIEKIPGTEIHEIDVSHARNLGNGSWGMIDFLTCQYRMFLCGLDDYCQKQGKGKNQ